jgi:glycine dehydrogenase
MPFELTTYEAYDFANRRHIGPSPSEMEEMLRTIGFDSLDALIDATVPEAIRQKAALDFGPAMSERDALHHMKQVASKNQVLTSLIGQGYHGTTTPAPILRNILENPAWYTAYTPYQPEISQGRLEALLNYQTMVSDLTGLDIANASLLDESTAAAEAMTMAMRSAKSKSHTFFVDENCHPQNIAVIQTRAEPLGIEVVVGCPDDLDASAVFGAIFQYPGTYGHVRDFTSQIAALHAHKALAIVAADPLSLALLKSPARWVRISPLAQRSALACPWAMGDRMRPIWPRGMHSNARCPAGSSASQSTVAAIKRCAWRCKPASSTFAAKKPIQMCVPLRRFWL